MRDSYIAEKRKSHFQRDFFCLILLFPTLYLSFLFRCCRRVNKEEGKKVGVCLLLGITFHTHQSERTDTDRIPQRTNY